MKDAAGNGERMGRALVRAGVIAEELGLTEDTVLRLARSGILPRVKVGPRAVRFDLQRVLEVLKGAK